MNTLNMTILEREKSVYYAAKTIQNIQRNVHISLYKDITYEIDTHSSLESMHRVSYAFLKRLYFYS